MDREDSSVEALARALPVVDWEGEAAFASGPRRRPTTSRAHLPAGPTAAPRPLP